MSLLDVYAAQSGPTSQPAISIPSTPGERFTAEREAADAPDSWWNLTGSRRDAWQLSIDALHKATGTAFPNPYGPVTPEEMTRLGNQPALIEERRQKIIEAHRTLIRDSGVSAELPDPELIDQQIGDRGRALRTRSASLVDTGSGLAAFAGGATALTPVNVGGFLIPPSRAVFGATTIARGFLAGVGREAAYQAVTQGALVAASEAVDVAARSETGSAPTFGEAAGNVVMGAAAGAVLGGGFHALFAGPKALWERWNRLPEDVKERAPLEVRDAMKVLGSDALYGETNRLGLPWPLHERYQGNALDAVMRGTAVRLDELTPAQTPMTALATILRNAPDRISVDGLPHTVARIGGLPDSELTSLAREMKPGSFTALDAAEARMKALDERAAAIKGEAEQIGVSDMVDLDTAALINDAVENLKRTDLTRRQRAAYEHQLATWTQSVDPNGALKGDLERLRADFFPEHGPALAEIAAERKKVARELELARGEAKREVDFLRGKLDKLEVRKPDEVPGFGIKVPPDLAATISREEMFRQGLAGDAPTPAQSVFRDVQAKALAAGLPAEEARANAAIIAANAEARAARSPEAFADAWDAYQQSGVTIERGEGADAGTTYAQSVTLREGKETLKKYGLDPEGKYKTREVAAALEARQRQKWGLIAEDDRSPKAANKIAKWIAEEVRFEMLHPEKSGVGWYSQKYQRALDQFSEAFPELKTDKDSRDLFTALVAITSDGAKVVANFKAAADIYGNFRKGGKTEGKFTTEVGSDRQASVQSNLENVQKIYDERGPQGMRDFLMQEATVSDLKKIAKASGQEFSTSYQAHIRLPMAAIIFGPKLGAFYANLMGAHGYLTMDRWWSRTFNRYRGTLLQKPTRDGLDRVKRLITDAERRNMPWQEMSDDEVLSAITPYVEAYKKKKYKNGTEIEKAANTVYKAAFEKLEDQPFNATDRTFMLDATERARKLLEKEGVTISTADIQAVLWYYEKRLYGELGARQTADISYEEAARKVVGEITPASDDRAGRSFAQSNVEGSGRGVAEGISPGEEAFGGVGRTYDQPVYHGGPHIFDKFDLNKVGTGEGAQAYGWGLYFAGNKAIAEFYREKLAGSGATIDLIFAAIRAANGGKLIGTTQDTGAIYSAVSNKGLSDAAAAKQIFARSSAMRALDKDASAMGPHPNLEKLVRDLRTQTKPGRLYHVEIPEDGAYLNWDKPLSEQSPEVLEKLKAAGFDVSEKRGGDGEGPFGKAELAPVTGREFYMGLADKAWLGGTSKTEAQKAASLALREAGIPGIQYLDGTSRGKGEGSHNYVLFDDSLAEIKNYEQRARGQITFNDNAALIRLFDERNASTLPHEAAHLFVEQLRTDAAHPKASEQIRGDWQTVLDYVGSTDGKLTTPQHEKLARAFESYLRDGQAPSNALVRVFEAFKDWLTKIYKQVTELDQVTPELRGVFDRMLATDEQIAGKLEAAEYDRMIRAVRENAPAGPGPSPIAKPAAAPKMTADGLAPEQMEAIKTAADAVLEGKSNLGDFKRVAVRELEAVDAELNDARAAAACVAGGGFIP